MTRKKKPENLNLAPGEQAYLAKNRLVLDHGRTKVVKGDVVILGQKDIEGGINIGHLLKIGAIEPVNAGAPLEEEEKDE